MAFNGSGTFNRLYTWVIDAANGIKIRADRMDAEMDGFATGLTDCVTRDGQSPWLDNLPAGGFHITNLGDGSLAGDSANLGQVQSLKAAFAVAAGTANVLTAAFTPTFVTLTDGMQLNVRALLKNTAAATFAPDAIAAHPITRLGGTALLAGDIAGPLHELILRYNLANTRWELLNPAGVNLPTLALGGATISSNALAVTGTSLFTGSVSCNSGGYRENAAQGYTTSGFSINTTFAINSIILGGANSNFQILTNTGAGVNLAWNSTSWTAVSKRELKRDLAPIEDPIGILKNVMPGVVTGWYKNDSADDRRRGFVCYEETELFWPSAATYTSAYSITEDVELETGEVETRVKEIPEFAGVALEQYVPLLLAIVDNLQTRLAAVETQLEKKK